MSRLLFIHTGSDSGQVIKEKFCRDNEIISVYNIRYTERKDIKPLENETIQYCDYTDKEAGGELLLSLFPADSVFIIPSAVSNDNMSDENVLRDMLNTVYHILQIIYPPLMRQRGVSLWITEPVCQLTGNEDGTASLSKATTRGIQITAKLAAMELARKNVAVNYLSGQQGYEGVGALIEWAIKRKKIFMTAQVLGS